MHGLLGAIGFIGGLLLGLFISEIIGQGVGTIVDIIFAVVGAGGGLLLAKFVADLIEENRKSQ